MGLVKSSAGGLGHDVMLGFQPMVLPPPVARDGLAFASKAQAYLKAGSLGQKADFVPAGERGHTMGRGTFPSIQKPVLCLQQLLS